MLYLDGGETCPRRDFQLVASAPADFEWLYMTMSRVGTYTCGGWVGEWVESCQAQVQKSFKIGRNDD